MIWLIIAGKGELHPIVGSRLSGHLLGSLESSEILLEDALILPGDCLNMSFSVAGKSSCNSLKSPVFLWEEVSSVYILT